MALSSDDVPIERTDGGKGKGVRVIGLKLYIYGDGTAYLFYGKNSIHLKSPFDRVVELVKLVTRMRDEAKAI